MCCPNHISESNLPVLSIGQRREWAVAMETGCGRGRSHKSLLHWAFINFKCRSFYDTHNATSNLVSFLNSEILAAICLL